MLGKTVLLQSNIVREVHRIAADPESGRHLVLICVWQMGADALLSEYRELKQSLPVADNLEVLVVTKDELMKRFKASEIELTTTTQQISTVCENIDFLIKDKTVHLFIDECWVTVPQKFEAHMTPVSFYNLSPIIYIFQCLGQPK